MPGADLEHSYPGVLLPAHFFEVRYNSEAIPRDGRRDLSQGSRALSPHSVRSLSSGAKPPVAMKEKAVRKPLLRPQ
ncbi:hypothetical protein GCM10010862_14000 [Devosia nitrariae]|uniref:Uncharacterized protein n=1 Tax=Devosia nitrariae TaxID=2071872 RepID=A0ABQ5W2S5_9HYPH|nr:hypothetical protein GCM10010862_14000 [Devosia nitrariae]